MKPPKSPSKQRKHTQEQHATPQRQRRTLSTPKKNRRQLFPNDSGVELLTSEDQGQEDENTSPVVKRLFVDPTPQKNGRVLGLFDLLSPVKEQASPFKGGPQDSPSKPHSALLTLDAADISNVEGRSLTTPRKRAYTEGDGVGASYHVSQLDVAGSPSKHSRTPQSAAKRYLLDTFVTPSKRRKVSEDAETPSNDRRQGQAFADGTPAFLRRDSQRFSLSALDDVPEEEEEDSNDDGFDAEVLSAKSSTMPMAAAQRLSPTKSRLQRSFSTGSKISKFSLGGRAPLRRSSSKSLSSMIAAMRQNEDDRLDEEMELMREMEDENDGYGAPARPGQLQRKSINTTADDDEEDEIPADVLVEDSQFPDISTAELGPDGSHVVDTESESDDPQQPKKAWKKKGLKRQTKRVLMRPVVRKQGAPAIPQTADTSDEIVEESQNATVAEDGAKESKAGNDDRASGSDYDQSDLELDLDTSDGNDDDSAAKASHRPSTKAPGKVVPASIIAASTGQKETGPVNKAVKKTSATANANFCKLKIRSAKGASGAKGIAFKRRFGRGKR